MSSKSSGPVKDEKSLFGKVKEAVTDILGGPQGNLVTDDKFGDKATTRKKRAATKSSHAKTVKKRRTTKLTPQAKTVEGRAQKQVIAAKAIAVNHNNIEPVKARKRNK
ncbi:hypothetical protein LT679_02960 [Mucilaginibacter roseus]|uniref:Uncharacterized protein n=1 Tax=Mucilaginibacter roseus TaxID=1528868 RepID=A0ABS8U0E6_9SPHI|nr:hypothetical protein [Mucilaginibacter roseus]MCD8739550.1 hypothetical protein [Mucilaginibacter roseus]